MLLLNPVYVTLFWAVVLSFYSPRRNAPKAFLGKFMAVTFVVYLSHFFYFSEQTDIYRIIDAPYIWASLLVYPLYHIYVRLLTVEKKFTLKSHTRYLFLPTLIFVLYLAGLLLMNKYEHTDFLQQNRAGLQADKGIHYFMSVIYNLWKGVFIAQVFYYLYANFMLIIKNNRQLQNFYSNIEGRQLNWIQFFNISLAVTSVSSIIVALAGREAFAENTYMLIVPSLVFSGMLFLIGLIGNYQSPAHTIQIEPTDTKIKEPQDDINISRLKSKLDNLFEIEKIFINPTLKIWDVSKMLGTNRTYVSKLINDKYNRNFCNHVNYYRIKHAKELIKNNPDTTNNQVADLAGFGSLNSFYRAFKSLEGISVKQFREQLFS